MSGDGRQRGVIRLTGRAAPAVELSQRTPCAGITGRGVLQVNLNWSVAAEADLDLGCMVLTRDGAGAAVQPLGAEFGDLDAWPYVSLDQDDRTGEASDGETLRISLEHRHQFTKLLVYVYIYERAADFRTLGGVVTVSAPSGTWRIHLDDSPAGATSCAIALLTPGRDTLELRREVRWFTAQPSLTNQQLIDQAYGFGFEWVPGVKPPL
ncbi:tellurium resistance protein [Streptomyces sp. HUAS TT20]|uniref:tellurium resistance protein n=1 Tax=Streptomyces sp. HUAS TT20 TaxID=3447509 RepID=UPI0021DB6820|nr:tellurium resistance protein [Streptomyces sp. HUAS 15-9]UXY31077.1 tellurium resistance protein [Streptomyces sp. HUAS 15-9]